MESLSLRLEQRTAAVLVPLNGIPLCAAALSLTPSSSIAVLAYRACIASLRKHFHTTAVLGMLSFLLLALLSQTIARMK